MDALAWRRGHQVVSNLHSVSTLNHYTLQLAGRRSLPLSSRQVHGGAHRAQPTRGAQSAVEIMSRKS